MQVHKPKVEYKLALQEKPQGSMLTDYYKTNDLTRIKWLNKRLIIASNKIRHEIPVKTKRVKYTAIWKKSIKIVKESKLSFSYHVSLLLLIFYCFSSSSSSFWLFSLLHHLLLLIFIVFPPPPPAPHFEREGKQSKWGGGRGGEGKTIKMRRRRRKNNKKWGGGGGKTIRRNV